MPTFKLDDQEIPFEKGETIIKAAYRQGINVPHYCWHPGLSTAANCRMCLVEIEPPPGQRPMMLDILTWDKEKKDYVPTKKPKLQPACQVPAAEGMVVRSETSKNVAEARSHVQEFLLLNHPVDCPICDQAGECMLQDYYMSEQRTAKRKLDEPNHKPKGVVFGPTIVYDAERCIACTRCIRVCDEVVGEHMLDMRERGNMYEITVSPGRTLEGKYTMLTEHICPVGALTTKYWRHKGRVWLLKSTPSVCAGCAQGCNTWLDTDQRENTAFRVRPRDNEAVNDYWLCDDGMLTYQRVTQQRVKEAKVGRKNGKTEEFDKALKKAAGEISKAGTRVAVVLSAQHSCEENLVLADIGKAIGATFYISGKPAWDGDQILRVEDQNPNRQGALLASGKEQVKPLADLIANTGEYQAIVILGADADVDTEQLRALESVTSVVLFTAQQGPLSASATVTIPIAIWAETDGCYVSQTVPRSARKNRPADAGPVKPEAFVQEFKKALTSPDDAIAGWKALSQLARELKLDVNFTKFAEVRAAWIARTQLSPIAAKKDMSVQPGSLTPRSGV